LRCWIARLCEFFEARGFSCAKSAAIGARFPAAGVVQGAFFGVGLRAVDTGP
jgi:hypothetical protein